jgi:DNA-binding transcriptional regulator YiaG
VPDTTKQNLLALAAKRLGRPELARRLNTPESLLEAWMTGHASMPDRKLLLLADLLDKIGETPEG